MYEETVRAKLQEEFNYPNVMQVPKLEKITLNMGLGRAVGEPKIMVSAVEELRAISGRTPVVTRAKKDIATFKLRKGHKIGCMVTLRREAMWEFLERFVCIALPRVRDFRGVSEKAFDGRGNYSIGVKEQIIFPEVDYDKVVPISEFGGRIDTSLAGPPNSFKVGDPSVTLPMVVYVDREAGACAIEISGQVVILEEGEWSEFLSLTFSPLRDTTVPHLPLCHTASSSIAP